MKNLLLLIILAVCFAISLSAGEPVAEKPVIQPSTWRPFKELQDVLFFESFEHPTSAAEHGKITSEDPAPPGGHVWKLETTTAESYMQLHVSQTQLRVPQGLNPNQIFIQVSVYVDEPGSVMIKCVHQKGEYYRETPVPKAKGWGLITFKLADLRVKNSIPEPDQVLKEIEVHVKPTHGKKEIPKAWVDDILLTYGANPVDIRGRVLQAEKRRLDMEKQYDRDGYAYTMSANEFLKTSVKPFKHRIKPKHVLVIGPTPELTSAWTKQLAAAALKLKETTYVFDPAEDPAGSDKLIGGLADMRTLLSYNLQKDPEFVLLAISGEDAMGPGRPSEILRVAIERAIDAGTVPVVCIPGPAKLDEKEKLGIFASTVEAMCAQLAAPAIDGANATKGAKGEFDAAKAGAPAFEKTVQLAFTAIKHVHDSMTKE